MLVWASMKFAAALFLSLSAALAQAPTPESVLGKSRETIFIWPATTNRWAISGKLAQATDKLKLVLGWGRPPAAWDWYIAVISSPQNLAKLDQVQRHAGGWRW